MLNNMLNFADADQINNSHVSADFSTPWFLLPDYCERRQFLAGDKIRSKGEHYTDMYLILSGAVEVLLENENHSIWLSAGSPVGEISFIKGCKATADVVARNQTTALLINRPILERLEQEHPAVLLSLLRALANISEERQTLNASLITDDSTNDFSPVSVLLCQNPQMLEQAQRLRYQVYCEEIGRTSPYADDTRKVLCDNLDAFGHTFIAVDKENNVIGTLRANFSAEGPLGILEDIYGMKKSADHPNFTVICTKFVIEKNKRGSRASAELIRAMRAFVTKAGARECYIDSIPKLVPLYKRIGFEIAGEKFLHYENGPSYPMVMDLTK